jgi:hypothetical protein
VAVNLTVVLPIGNWAGALLEMVGKGSQVSAAEAMPARLTAIVVALAVGKVAVRVVFDKVSTGGVVSRTVT